MRARLITDLEKDLVTVREWWKGHKHPEIPAEALPKVGIIIEGDEIEQGSDLQPQAVGWLYECNSAPVAWVEWITANPALSPFAVRRSVGTLLKFMVEEATRNGYVILFSTCRQQALGRILESEGFVKTDDSVSHFLRIQIERKP